MMVPHANCRQYLVFWFKSTLTTSLFKNAEPNYTDMFFLRQDIELASTSFNIHLRRGS